MECPAHAELHGLPRPRLGGGGKQLVDGGVLSRDDDLARAVVVRRPHVLDAGAELLDDRVLQTEDGGHRAGFLPRRLGRRAAPFTHECECVPVAERLRRGQGRVFADRVADDVVGLDPHRPHGPQARDRGRDERGLLLLRLGELFDRPLEAEPRDIEADRLARLVEHRAGLGILGGDRLAHADVLGALAGEAEGDLHATACPSFQTVYAEPQVSPAPMPVMRTLVPFASLPAPTASARQSGIEAEDVFP